MIDRSGGTMEYGPNRIFTICKDHRNTDWNPPTLEDSYCILCRLFYLEAQESLLEEWQQRATRAEATIEEIKRPLDAQMARLNETVTRLNGENERLRAVNSATRATQNDPVSAKALEQDAARYRFWREHHRGVWVTVIDRDGKASLKFDPAKPFVIPGENTAENIDAAIDASMARTEQGDV
jgi:hypothetical protein